MNRKLLMGAALSAALVFSGCSVPEKISQKYQEEQAKEEFSPTPVPERVYMDKLTGILSRFDGQNATLSNEEGSFTFDLSQATLECEHGMITGDEISVIYEGQLEGSDLSGVTALKVVDEIHKQTEPVDHSIRGTVKGFTLNTLTIQDDQNRLLTFPVAGTRQYYSKGIGEGSVVYLHYLGELPEISASDAPAMLTGIRVVTVSDIEPYERPKSLLSQKTADGSRTAKLRGTITGLRLNSLDFVPEGSETVLTADIKDIPLSFSGGFPAGAAVTFLYIGEEPSGSLEGTSLLAAQGDTAEGLKDSRITSSVSGYVAAVTADTLTLVTEDSARLTCRTQNVPSQLGFIPEVGDTVRVVFDPASCRQSNILASKELLAP